MREQLLKALVLSLLPNDLSIQEGRNVLETAKTLPGFLKEMVLILADSNVISSQKITLELRTAAACAVKELILNHYDYKEGCFTISNEEKQSFKESIFPNFCPGSNDQGSEVEESNHRKTMEETYKKAITSDFPKLWPDLATGIVEAINPVMTRLLSRVLFWFSQ